MDSAAATDRCGELGITKRRVAPEHGNITLHGKGQIPNVRRHSVFRNLEVHGRAVRVADISIVNVNETGRRVDGEVAFLPAPLCRSA